MANVILIKRSTTSSDPGLSLSSGELAYSYISNKLYIGSSSGSGNGALVIGGLGAFADYAPLNSPTFTGTPAAPTAILSDNSTQLATTAFVKNQNYLTNNQNISILGDASGSGSTSITLTLANTGVTSGTYSKVTVDAKGRVISGATLTAADIPTLTSAKISDFNTQVRTSRLDQMAAPIATVDFNSQVISGVAMPVNPTDAANKQYVDSARSGLDTKDSVRVASTTNVNISAPGANIDGVTLSNGNRVLLKDQTNAAQNAIYVFNGSGVPMTRATDADSNSEVTSGMYCFVSEGTVNANNGFVLITPDPINLGTTALTFAQNSGAGQLVAGNGLTKNGNQLDINTASSSRIVINADNIDLATTGITPGTYKSVTVDVYGRVGAGTNPTTLSGYGITDAQPLDQHLTALSSLTTTGLTVFTSNNTAVTRTLTGVANRLTVINGDGVNGNPTFDIASTYPGQTSINTLGTITTGTWQGTVVALAYGGTGTSNSFTGIVKSNGTSFVAATAHVDFLTSTSTLDGGVF